MYRYCVDIFFILGSVGKSGGVRVLNKLECESFCIFQGLLYCSQHVSQMVNVGAKLELTLAKVLARK